MNLQMFGEGASLQDMTAQVEFRTDVHFSQQSNSQSKENEVEAVEGNKCEMEVMKNGLGI